MVYRKLRRVHSHGYLSHIPEFKKHFPELNHLSSDDLSGRFDDLGVEFFIEDIVKVKPFVRMTLPLYFIVWIILFVTLPIKYLITGSWWYDHRNSVVRLLYNWSKSLKL